MGAISAEKLAFFEQVTKAGQCDFEGLMQDLVRLEPGKVMRLAKSGKKTAAGVRSIPFLDGFDHDESTPLTDLFRP